MHDNELALRILDYAKELVFFLFSLLVYRYLKRKDAMAAKLETFGEELNEARMAIAHIQGELGLARRIKYTEPGDGGKRRRRGLRDGMAGEG